MQNSNKVMLSSEKQGNVNNVVENDAPDGLRLSIASINGRNYFLYENEIQGCGCFSQAITQVFSEAERDFGAYGGRCEINVTNKELFSIMKELIQLELKALRLLQNAGSE